MGATCFQNKLILKAKALGYETHVFAWKCGDVGEKSADFFYPISIMDKDLILEQCKKINPVAVCSIASDVTTITANYVARGLGLNANSEICDKLATNKFEMRNALKKARLNTPIFYKITQSEMNEEDILEYPVIVKPTDRSGSRAITKVDCKEDLELAVYNATRESFENAAIVESFIEGDEYSCECISFKGEHTMLAITQKFTTGAPNYIETGHMEPACISDFLKHKICKNVFQALDALEIKNGASHTEFKIDNRGNVHIIEVGPRMGGDCIGSDLVYLSTGNDFLKMVIDVAQGNMPDILVNPTHKNVAIKFFMNSTDLNLLHNLPRDLCVEEIYIDDNQINNKLVQNSTMRLGYVIVSGTYERIKTIL